jgi:hypothetical protein
MINTHETGAVQIQIPCHCSIRMAGREHLEPSFPCTNDVPASTLLHILPAAWSILDSAYIEAEFQHETATYENMTDILNHQWKPDLPDLPVFNYTIDEQALFEKIRPPKLLHYTATSYVPSLMFVWNLGLSVLVAFLLYRQLQSPIIPVLAAGPVRYVRVDVDQELGALEATMITFLIMNGLIALIFMIILIRMLYVCLFKKTEQPLRSLIDSPKRNNAQYQQARADDDLVTEDIYSTVGVNRPFVLEEYASPLRHQGRLRTDGLIGNPNIESSPELPRRPPQKSARTHRGTATEPPTTEL